MWSYWITVKERYEVHHGVRITDGALVSAVTLSHRYIADRFLPDKVALRAHAVIDSTHSLRPSI